MNIIIQNIIFEYKQVLQNIKKAISFKKNKVEEKPEWDTDILQTCKILYCQNSKAMSETCMCWGLECGEGWKRPLRKLSLKLEALNLEHYPKYNIRIQADQVKEKFGTLRFYYSVVVEPCKIIKAVISVINVFIKLLNKVNYGVIFKDAKYTPTKYTTLYNMKKSLQSFIYALKRLPINYSQKQKLMAEYLDDVTRDLVRKAEDECENYCESCGNNIGENGYHEKCQTIGWIKYICEVCAEKGGRRYLKDGALYQEKTCIKTKEELDKDREAAEVKAD